MLSDLNLINIAVEVSKASQCVSKQVGAIIVKDNRILSSGYNGTPYGYENCNKHWEFKDNPEHHEWSHTYEIHAEMNAIIWAARKGICIEGATVYVTLEPCNQCTKNLIGAGVKEIVYLHNYKHVDKEVSDKFLSDCNVIKRQITGI